MLAGTVLTGIIAFFLNSNYSGKMIGYPSFDQLKDVLPFYGMGIALALSVYFFRFIPISNYLIVLIQAIVSAVVFFSLCRLFRIREYDEIKQIVLQYLTKIKR